MSGGAPIGAYVRIYYDGLALSAGDALVTPTGRMYEVVSVRVQARGAHVGRQHLVCLVHDGRTPVKGRIRRLHWYRRGRSPA